MLKVKKTIEYLVLLFIFLLPWQAVWIFREGMIGGKKWQYGTMGVSGVEALLFLILILWAAAFVLEKRKIIFNFQFFLQRRIFEIFNEFFRQRRIRLWRTIFQFSMKILSMRLLVAVFLFWSFASIFWSADKGLALYYWIHLLEGAVLIFLILKLKSDFRKIAWAVVLSGAAQGFLATWQFMSQKVVANKWLGVASHLPADLGASVIEDGGARWLRAYGLFAHPNILGGFLAIVLLLAIWLYASFLDHPLAPSLNQGGGRIKKACLSACLLVVAAGLFFSFSRSAWVGFVAAYSIWLIVYGKWRMANNGLRVAEQKKYFGVLRITIYLFILFAALFLLYRPLIMTRVLASERLEAKSVEQRLSSYGEAKEIIKNNWLLGTGIGNYTPALYKRDPSHSAIFYQPPHNLYLLVLAESGVIGFFIFLSILFFCFFSAVKKYRENVIGLSLLSAVRVIAMFDHYFWTSHFGVMMLFLAVAGAASENNN